MSALIVFIVPHSVCAGATSGAVAVPHSAYVFSASTCLISNNNIEYGANLSIVGLDRAKKALERSIVRLNSVYVISGDCVKVVEAAELGNVFLSGDQAIYLDGDKFSRVLNSSQGTFVTPPVAKIVTHAVRHERQVYGTFGFGHATSVWRHRSGLYNVRITSDPEVNPQLQPIIVKSNSRLLSATYSPGIHAGGGQVTLLQEQPNGSLKLIIIDVRL